MMLTVGNTFFSLTAYLWTFSSLMKQDSFDFKSNIVFLFLDPEAFMASQPGDIWIRRFSEPQNIRRNGRFKVRFMFKNICIPVTFDNPIKTCFKN